MPIGKSEQTPTQLKKERFHREDLTHFTIESLSEQKEFLEENIEFANKIVDDGDKALQEANETLEKHDNQENKNILLKGMLRRLKKIATKLYDDESKTGLITDTEKEKEKLEEIQRLVNKISGQELISQQNVGNDFQKILKRGLDQFVDDDADGLADSLEVLDEELEKIEKQIKNLNNRIENFSNLPAKTQETITKVIITTIILAVTVGSVATINFFSNIKTPDNNQPQTVETVTVTEGEETQTEFFRESEVEQKTASFEETIQQGGSALNAYYNAVGIENENLTDEIVVYRGDDEIVSGTVAEYRAGDKDQFILQPGDSVQIFTGQN